MVTKWTNKIDELTTEFKKDFGELPVKELNWKPDASVWSIAENMDHLIVVNKTYFPILEEVRAGKHKLPFLAKFKFVPRFLGKLILKNVQPDRKRKIKTFKMWQPLRSTHSINILQQFAEHQEELKQWISSHSDLLHKNVIIASPANPNLVYQLETAFDIIVAHEERHLVQAREILTRIKSLQ